MDIPGLNIAPIYLLNISGGQRVNNYIARCYHEFKKKKVFEEEKKSWGKL